jgi:hypothetical protein
MGSFESSAKAAHGSIKPNPNVTTRTPDRNGRNEGRAAFIGVFLLIIAALSSVALQSSVRWRTDPTLNEEQHPTQWMTCHPVSDIA